MAWPEVDGCCHDNCDPSASWTVLCSISLFLSCLPGALLSLSLCNIAGSQATAVHLISAPRSPPPNSVQISAECGGAEPLKQPVGISDEGAQKGHSFEMTILKVRFNKP